MHIIRVVGGQAGDSDFLLNFTREMLHLQQDNPALRHGAFDILAAKIRCRSSDDRPRGNL